MIIFRLLIINMFVVVNLCSVRIHRCTVISYESSPPTPISGPKAKYLELTGFVLQQKKIQGRKPKTRELTWTI